MSKEPVQSLIDQAISLAEVWDPNAEDTYREAINAAILAGDAHLIAYAWTECGQYLLRRLQFEAAQLAFDAARRTPEAPSQYPNFEERFREGRLRFDGPTTLIRPLKERTRHYQQTRFIQAIHGRLRSGAWLLLQLVLILGAPVLLAVIAFRISTHHVVIRIGAIALVLIVWSIWIRLTWRIAQEVFHELYLARLNRVLSRMTEKSSTHEDAIAALERFAKTREPFALYLRSFEAEAHEYQSRSPLTLTPGTQPLGECNPRQSYITNWHSGPTDLDNYLSEKVSPHLPIITLSNPAAASPNVGGGKSAILRLEVANERWEAVVRMLISAAQFIVVEAVVDGSGLRAELQFINEERRVADAMVVLSSANDRQEILRHRAMVGKPLDQEPAFVSAVSPLLNGFGRVVDVAQIDGKDPTSLTVFQGLLPKQANTTLESRVNQRRDRRDRLAQAKDSLYRGYDLLRQGANIQVRKELLAAQQGFALVGSPTDESSAGLGIAQTYFLENDLATAERYLRCAAALQRDAGPPAEYLRTLRTLADYLQDHERFEEAKVISRDLQEACSRWELALVDRLDTG